MSRTHLLARIPLAVSCFLLCLATPLLAQRADRAVISGVVTDNQGAAVPGATVTIKNEDTGVENALVTNNAGAYTSPPLVLGRYSVTVDLTGFKKMVASGILLQGGGAIRHDVALQVGNLTESVEVRSVAGISETRPERGTGSPRGRVQGSPRGEAPRRRMFRSANCVLTC